MNINDIIQKSLDGDEITKDEIAALYSVPAYSKEAFLMQAASREKSKKASGGLAEVHAEIGLNAGPCPMNCNYCAFAARNEVYPENKELSVEEAVKRARRFEEDGASLLFIESTAHYQFGKFLEVSQEIGKSLKNGTVLWTNIGDLSPSQSRQLKEAGFSGIYHAVRMGEGKDTQIPPEKRLETIRNAKDAGLRIGFCVEPIGPEHSVEELTEKTIISRDSDPAFGGALRRTFIPNSGRAQSEVVSEARMAHYLAVVRLALGYDVAGHYAHAPNVVGVAVGANLICAEVGYIPRETEVDLKGKMTVEDCRTILTEADWEILAGPSRICS